MRSLAVFGVFLAANVGAATFTVTNTNDSGAGSLRQAILDANATPGFDTIAFNIPGPGVHTITPATNFDTILEAVVIDGYTQPGTTVNTDPVGTNALLLIELDGTAMAGAGLGFNINSAAPTTVRGLVMNRWGALAIQTAGGSVGAVVAGNFLGTDPTGTTALPNGTAIGPAGNGTTIGGGAPAERNLISGNSHGVYVQEHGTIIRGNLIGTDATGMLALGNSNSGVFCASFGGTGTTIGGTGAGEGNVISGNTNGISISQGLIVNVVQGDKIGVNAAGTGPLGNAFGIATTTGGTDSIIGGIGPGEANEIAYNSADGVRINGGGVDNVIRGNSIHDNGGLGIALDGGAPHFNDLLDADDGPNHAQNFPILQTIEHSLSQGSGNTHVFGKLNSAPSTTYDLDFYSNPVCSNFPREFVEGETWIGTAQVTTDASGHADLDVNLPVGTEVGARITATATDPNGNTSELSQRIIFSIFPVSGPDTGGTVFEALGTDFADPTTITVGGVPPTNVTFVNDHQLSAAMPAFPPGTSQDVVVTTPDGTTGTRSRAGSRTFSTCPGCANLPQLRRHAHLQRHHRRHRRRPLRRRSGHYASRWPSFCSAPSTASATRRRPALSRSSMTCPALPSSPPGSTSSSPRASRAAAPAAATTTARPARPSPADGRPAAADARGQRLHPAACTVETFTDVSCTSLFGPWIYDLVARGITAGCGGGLYCPTLSANRGQMADVHHEDLRAAMRGAASWQRFE